MNQLIWQISYPLLRRTIFSLCSLPMLLSGASAVWAVPTNYYWDIDGATPGPGGTAPAGSWTTAVGNWSTSTTGNVATGNWINGPSDDANRAIFSAFNAAGDGTGTFTVTVGDSSGANFPIANYLSVDRGNITFDKHASATSSQIRFDNNSSGGNWGFKVATGSNATVTNNIDLTVVDLIPSSGIFLFGGSSYRGTAYVGNARSYTGNSLLVGSGTFDLIGALQGTLMGKQLWLVGGAADDAVFQTNGTYSPALGTGVLWNPGNSGGFSARLAGLTVNLGGAAAPMTFGVTSNFLSSGATLNFGSITSDAVVLFVNDLNFNGATQTIKVVANNTAGTNDWTVLGGALQNGNLTKTGDGLLVLEANNNAGGTPLVNITISGGSLQVGNGASTGTLGTGTVTNDGILSFLRTDNVTIGNLISGTGQVWQRGIDATDKTTLTNANTFSGATTPINGVLVLGNTLAIQNSTLNMATGVTGTLSFGSLTSATIGGLTGTRDLTLQNDSSTAVALSLGNNNTNQGYSGVLSGSGSLIKIGTQTQTLSGANTYTGDTTVSGGTLLLGGNNRIANASDLILNGGTFSTGGFSETLATIDLDANSILNFGTGTSILTFASSSGVSWTGGALLTINNWSGLLTGSGTDQFFVGNLLGGLTPTQLSQIQFTGYGIGATQLSTGEIVPYVVPEPSTLAMLLFGSMVLWFVRKQQA